VLGADEAVPATELVVVSRLLVVAADVVVVAPEVEVTPDVEVAPEVNVAARAALGATSSTAVTTARLKLTRCRSWSRPTPSAPSAREHTLSAEPPASVEKRRAWDGQTSHDSRGVQIVT